LLRFFLRLNALSAASQQIIYALDLISFLEPLWLVNGNEGGGGVTAFYVGPPTLVPQSHVSLCESCLSRLCIMLSECSSDEKRSGCGAWLGRGHSNFQYCGHILDPHRSKWLIACSLFLKLSTATTKAVEPKILAKKQQLLLQLLLVVGPIVVSLLIFFGSTRLFYGLLTSRMKINRNTEVLHHFSTETVPVIQMHQISKFH